MEISAKDIKTLRDTSGAGLMDCKKALIECNGDIEAALKHLREKGLSAMAKRSDRVTAEGRIFIKQDATKITMLELVCETDFVAKSPDFIKTGERLTALSFEKDLNEVTEEHKSILNELAIKIRENMSVRRLVTVKIPEGYASSTYIHHNFKIGSIVILKGNNSEEAVKLSHILCLHLASKMPQYIKKEDVPADYIKEQEEVFKAQIAQDESLSQKNDKVKEGILRGRVNKHLADLCFMDQPFIDDEKKTVKQAVADAGKSMGTALEVSTAIVYVLGK